MILQGESLNFLIFPVLKEMVDWFNAIRAARFHYLQVAFPGASQSDVSICTHTHMVHVHTHSLSLTFAPFLCSCCQS